MHVLLFFHYQVPIFYLSSGFCSKLSVFLCFPLLHFLSLPFCFKQRSLKSCFMDVMDLREKKSLGEDMLSENNKKFCTDCKTTKTPLWRGGPAGPKSLCNACGIRYRKKRRAMLGLNKGSEKKKERSHSSHSTPTTSSSSIATTDNVGEKKKVSGKFNGLSETVKLRFFALGSEVLLQRSSSSSTASFSPLLSGVVKKQRCQRRRKLGEEEQAAFSLMALSCGSVFA